MESESIVNVYRCDNIIMYLLYLLFQENKSFGVRTICIHPLMQEAVSGTVISSSSTFWSILGEKGGVIPSSDRGRQLATDIAGEKT